MMQPIIRISKLKVRVNGIRTDQSLYECYLDYTKEPSRFESQFIDIMGFGKTPLEAYHNWSREVWERKGELYGGVFDKYPYPKNSKGRILCTLSSRAPEASQTTTSFWMRLKNFFRAAEDRRNHLWDGQRR